MSIATKEYETNQGAPSALSQDELVTLLSSLVYFGFASSLLEKLCMVIAVQDRLLLDQVLRLEQSLLAESGMQKRSCNLSPRAIEAQVKQLVEKAGRRQSADLRAFAGAFQGH